MYHHLADQQTLNALVALRQLQERLRKERELARIKTMLARVLEEKHFHIEHALLTEAIFIGHNKLDTGKTFDQAAAIAEAHIQAAQYDHESLGMEAADPARIR